MHEQAGARAGAAADAPAQLVQLGQAEALGALDHHQRGIGDVDADLDHRGRHQDVQHAGAELFHDLIALVEVQAPVDQAHPAVRQRGAQGGVALGGVGEVDLVALFDERADPEGLPPRRHRATQGRHRARRPGPPGQHPRHRRRPPRRQLVELGDVEIAVQRQGQRARDRRRGHDQQVRHHALFAQRRPLGDPEAVLLVDDHQPQIGELDPLGQKGVGPD